MKSVKNTSRGWPPKPTDYVDLGASFFSRWASGFYRRKKLLELNFFVRKTFFMMVKPARWNHSQRSTIYPGPVPWMKTPGNYNHGQNSSLGYCNVTNYVYFTTEVWKKKHCYPFKKALLPSQLPYPIQCWKSGEIESTSSQHCMGSGGKVRQVRLYSHLAWLSKSAKSAWL